MHDRSGGVVGTTRRNPGLNEDPQVLRESQAWFREQTRRFLEEGSDPAF